MQHSGLVPGVDKAILPMSPMAMVSAGALAADAVHETVLPSAETVTVPSFFLYCAAAVDMLVEGQ